MQINWLTRCNDSMNKQLHFNHMVIRNNANTNVNTLLGFLIRCKNIYVCEDKRDTNKKMNYTIVLKLYSNMYDSHFYSIG